MKIEIINKSDPTVATPAIGCCCLASALLEAALRGAMAAEEVAVTESSDEAYQRSLLLDEPGLYRGLCGKVEQGVDGVDVERSELYNTSLSQKDRNKLAKACAKCGRPMEEWQKTWARNGDYAGIRYHKSCRNRPFPSLRQLNINMAGRRTITGDTESEEELPTPQDDGAETDDEEEEDDKPPPSVEELPEGLKWNKFQGFYKGQPGGFAAIKFREYQIHWARAAVRDAERRGEVPILDNCLLPRGLKWPEFCRYFAVHPVEVCQERWEHYLRSAERVAQPGDPLISDTDELIGQHVLIEDSMERGVIVSAAPNGVFTVSFGNEEKVEKRGYELYLADSDEQILKGTPSGSRPRRRAPPQLQPKKPTGPDMADRLWGQKKRGAKWDVLAMSERKRSHALENSQTQGSSSSKIVIDSWGGHWDSQTGMEVDPRRQAALDMKIAAAATAAAAARAVQNRNVNASEISEAPVRNAPQIVRSPSLRECVLKR